MGYPDFFCMGFQKCGTTTLYEILRQHPGTVLCRDVKEPMYYRVPFLHILGGRWYYRLRYFGHVKKGDPRLKGEVNAGLTFTRCAQRLRGKVSPDVKMLFLMRDPVERSYSSYKYFLTRGFLPRDAVEYDAEHGHAAGFDHYVHSVLDDPHQRGQIMKKRLRYLVFSQSNYASCIQDYLRYFDVHNMKFIFFEEFVRNQHAACREIYDFLGLPDAPAIDYNVKANEDKERPVSYRAARRVMIAKGMHYGFYEFLGMGHWAPPLYGLVRKHYQRVRQKGIVDDLDRSRVLPQTREYLLDYFGPELRALEALTGRDPGEVWNLRSSPRLGEAVS